MAVNAGDILNYDYSGTYKTITLPKGVYKLECWGAQGGYRSSSSYGGKGGYSVGTITLQKETTLYIYAGGSGNSVSSSSNSIYPGGFNGGGYRYGYKGGGGASDIRVGSNSLYARVIVAGGGGSDGASNKNGMYGGGTTGGSSSQSYGSGGYGGTQTGNTWLTTTQGKTNSSSNCYAGFGFGGFGYYVSSGYGGAGGGGWYGGSGSRPDGSGDDDRGGGGGSGYVYTSSTASNYPSGCLLNSSYYLANAQTIAGNSSFTSPAGGTETGHIGNGYCRITVISVESGVKLRCLTNNQVKMSKNVYVKVNGSWRKAKNVFAKIGGAWKQNTSNIRTAYAVDVYNAPLLNGGTIIKSNRYLPDTNVSIDIPLPNPASDITYKVAGALISGDTLNFTQTYNNNVCTVTFTMPDEDCYFWIYEGDKTYTVTAVGTMYGDVVSTYHEGDAVNEKYDFGGPVSDLTITDSDGNYFTDFTISSSGRKIVVSFIMPAKNLTIEESYY